MHPEISTMLVGCWLASCLRALCHIWNNILEDTAKSIACSIIHGQLDYCNSVLYGTSAANLNMLPCTQNSAVRIVTKSRRSDHATPILTYLHWLSIKYHIEYKIAVIVYNVLTMQESSYLADITGFHAPCCRLRSSNRNLLQKDRTNLVFTDHSFSQAAPIVWNNLLYAHHL